MPFGYQAQAQVSADSLRMKKDVYHLADDRLHGRLAGTKYERKAGDYIIKQMKAAGLQPFFNTGWREPFSFRGNVTPRGRNIVKLDGRVAGVAMAASGNGKVKGKLRLIEAAMPGHPGVSKAKLDAEAAPVYIINLARVQADPHSTESMWKQAIKGLDAAAALYMFYNTPSDYSIEGMRGFTRVSPEKAMLVQLSDTAILSKPLGTSIPIDVSVNQYRPEIHANNVAGIINNGAERTIVIGAHYDHLGHDEFGNSLHRGEKAIHNGADDNASGTAMMLELARMLKQHGSKKLNYVFIAFSAEELGLLGSKVAAEKMTPKPMAMLNMDMVGRIDKLKPELGVFGTGTSPAWDTLLNGLPIPYQLKMRTDGLGSSDHSSFYMVEVPALHFFSGFHSDYHKPGDDAKNLNYPGMTHIGDYIYTLSQKMAEYPGIMRFTPTKNENENSRSFKVTLGIVPDYFFEEKGIKVDGVSAGKPAAHAGLQKGDIVDRLGEYETNDIQAYMRALGKFNKGEKTIVHFRRDGREMEAELTF